MYDGKNSYNLLRYSFYFSFFLLPRKFLAFCLKFYLKYVSIHVAQDHGSGGQFPGQEICKNVSAKTDVRYILKIDIVSAGRKKMMKEKEKNWDG